MYLPHPYKKTVASHTNTPTSLSRNRLPSISTLATDKKAVVQSDPRLVLNIMVSTSSRVADLFFYEELKTEVGVAQAKQWLKSTPSSQMRHIFARRNGSSSSIGSCCSSETQDPISEKRPAIAFHSARRSSAGTLPSCSQIGTMRFVRRWSSEENLNVALPSPTHVDKEPLKYFPDALDLAALKNRFKDVGLIYTDAAHKLLDDEA